MKWKTNNNRLTQNNIPTGETERQNNTRNFVKLLIEYAQESPVSENISTTVFAAQLLVNGDGSS